MQYITYYHSPVGKILLSTDYTALTGLWFEEQKYFAANLPPEYEERNLPIFKDATRWLDIYFSGQNPDFSIPLHLTGTSFQIQVWEILCSIPYGDTMTYGKIAEKIAQHRGISHMSAQAVGGAVGHNPISILVPCHRVIGSDGSLTGYAGGVEKKRWLLKLEKAPAVLK